MVRLTLRQLERHLYAAAEDFEYPDLLAYEYLIGEFADSAGKKGGEFYTPRPVVRLMVRLAKPETGMKVYDPCSGSGGMLVLAKEYLDEPGSNEGLSGHIAASPVRNAWHLLPADAWQPVFTYSQTNPTTRP